MELRRFTNKTDFTNYIPLPRSVLELGLNSTAMILYGVLLDRATLSKRNNYCNESGWVYVVYPIEELAQRLRLGHTTIKDSLRCLEHRGLVRKCRPSRREANRLFLCIPADAVTDTRTDGIPSPDRRKSAGRTAAKPSPSNINKQQYKATGYQHEQEESF